MPLGLFFCRNIKTHAGAHTGFLLTAHTNVLVYAAQRIKNQPKNKSKNGHFVMDRPQNICTLPGKVESLDPVTEAAKKGKCSYLSWMLPTLYCDLLAVFCGQQFVCS